MTGGSGSVLFWSSCCGTDLKNQDGRGKICVPTGINNITPLLLLLYSETHFKHNIQIHAVTTYNPHPGIWILHPGRAGVSVISKSTTVEGRETYCSPSDNNNKGSFQFIWMCFCWMCGKVSHLLWSCGCTLQTRPPVWRLALSHNNTMSNTRQRTTSHCVYSRQ